MLSDSPSVGTWRPILQRRVRCRPEWGACSSPRGSTRPSGTSLASLGFSSAGHGPAWAGHRRGELHAVPEDLKDAPYEHPRHHQPAHFLSTNLSILEYVNIVRVSLRAHTVASIR